MEKVRNKASEFVRRKFDTNSIYHMFILFSFLTKRFHCHMRWTVKMRKIFLSKMGFQARLLHHSLHKKKVKKNFKSKHFEAINIG